ncbi:hypothetical protein HPB50_021014 [Hyalomma asiaticum]|uniref:Uncharacterized protein n=1 Tax=Hyalomma asiaticum TaxID=266040 RepID=A0ACB7SUC3_HYAAI|nr:hypothetical protein HPB50_021014 [Hyalomma asiaticum]
MVISIVFYVIDKGTSLLGLNTIKRLGIKIDGASLTCRLERLRLPHRSVNVPPGIKRHSWRGVGRASSRHGQAGQHGIHRSTTHKMHGTPCVQYTVRGFVDIVSASNCRRGSVTSRAVDLSVPSYKRNVPASPLTRSSARALPALRWTVRLHSLPGE